MNLPQNKNLLRWILIVAAFLAVAVILWNTNIFFKKFKQEERMKMEVIATALQNMNNPDLNVDTTLELKIIESNKNIPMILTDVDDNIVNWNNLDVKSQGTYEELPTLERLYLSKQLEAMKGENKPLLIYEYGSNDKVYQKIYYRDSDLLNKLQYYPFALVLILVLFGTIIFLVFKSNKAAEQNKLWAGMAKETAHQIGTPLSSLLGWVEILRMENTDENTVSEIEKDIERLNTIADRFSKIGSVPKLERHEIISETRKAFEYYASRSSKQIDFQFNADKEQQLYAMINPQLYSWVIENLIKNAIDAMEGKGTIHISVAKKNTKLIHISVVDTGKGIPKKLYKKIFEPGFTTKKRGWGLGLSLTKRIIDDYHDGRVYVEKSETNVGTTMGILLKEL